MKKESLLQRNGYERNECGKYAFDTMEQAREVMSKAAYMFKEKSKHVRGQVDKKPSRIYYCPHCGKFHLTSQKKPVKDELHFDNKETATMVAEKRGHKVFKLKKGWFVGTKEQFKKLT